MMYRFIRVFTVVSLAAVSLFALGFIQSAHVVSAQQDTKALAQAYIDAQNAAIKSGNSDAVWALYSPDFVAQDGKTGADALAETKQSFGIIATAFPDAVITVKDIVASADEAAVYQTVSGTNTGTLLGVPPTGKAFKDINSIDIITFKDGKIVKDVSVTDTINLFSEVGWSVNPPAAGAGAATPAQ